jgi:hypothetical protein
VDVRLPDLVEEIRWIRELLQLEGAGLQHGALSVPGQALTGEPKHRNDRQAHDDRASHIPGCVQPQATPVDWRRTEQQRAEHREPYAGGNG